MKPLTIGAGVGSTAIKQADLLQFITQEDIDAGEKRFDIETRGPWGMVSKVAGLAVTASWDGSHVDTYTLHGTRTLQGAHESGHEMEGRVSIQGKNYRAFTSSILFEVEETGKLVDVACLHVCKEEKGRVSLFQGLAGWCFPIERPEFAGSYHIKLGEQRFYARQDNQGEWYALPLSDS